MSLFATKVKNALRLIPQPNAYTCQSACVGMATDNTNVMSIRAQLQALGEPGDPHCMGQLLRQKLGDRYVFDDNASLSEMRDWLKAGEFLITHGWFTGSGHVIALDGVEIDSTTLSYKFSVNDPWDEFDFKSWSYLGKSVGFQGFYSSYGIYAACVAGQSFDDAARIYRKGELDSMCKGAWVHRIKP